MIGVQKRKSISSAANKFNPNQQQQTPSQTTTTKSSRKRTKLQPNRSHSVSLAANQKLQQQTTSRQVIQVGKDQYGSVQVEGAAQNNGGNASSDESVWIFGLINNIEQLLSTFTAINTNSTTSCNNSGTSTPTSLSSSFSFSSANSTCTPSSSSASSRSTSASASPASAASPSSTTTNTSPSTIICQPAAASLSTLPRSPISRQIKFHEYKGPPSAKRQPQQAAKPQQQPSSNAAAEPQQSSPITANAKCAKSSSIAASLNSRVPVRSSSMAASKHSSNSKLLNDTTKQQAHDVSPMRARIAPGAAVYTAGLPNNLAQANLLQGSADEQQTDARQVLNYQQQHQVNPCAATAAATVAHSMPIQQHQPQRRQVAQNQLTSGPQCAHLQTFYINQQSTLENSVHHWPTVLLAPFIDTNNKQALVNVQHNNHHHHQPQLRQQQQSQELLLMQMQSASCGAAPSLGSNGSAGCGSAALERSMLPVEAGQQTQVHHLPLDADVRQGPKRYQSTFGIELENSTAPSSSLGQQQTPEYVQPFDYHNHEQQQHAFCSQEFNSLGDDLATLEPDREDTDACEIEPSISFSHGVEELLFSEFIDLQDVPMNVDESDWLKKFLPPCSMG